MKSIKIYVGCGLAYAPTRYKKMIQVFKDSLRRMDGVEILDFVNPPPGQEQSSLDPAHVYYHDIHVCVAQADIFIAELSHPSTGLGWELATSVEKRSILTIMCAKEKKKISHIPIGAVKHNEHVSFYGYKSSIKELLPILKERILEFQKQAA